MKQAWGQGQNCVRDWSGARGKACMNTCTDTRLVNIKKTTTNKKNPRGRFLGWRNKAQRGWQFSWCLLRLKVIAACLSLQTNTGENIFLSCFPVWFVRRTCVKWEKISVIQWRQLFLRWRLHIRELAAPQNPSPFLLGTPLTGCLKNMCTVYKDHHLFVQAWVGNTHTYSPL